MPQKINFKPLFDYLDVEFKKIDVRFDQIDDKFNTLQTSVDNLAKMVKDFEQEHIIMHRRLEVLEAWAKNVSEKFGVPLPQM